jgi:hypothetical protein
MFSPVVYNSVQRPVQFSGKQPKADKLPSLSIEDARERKGTLMPKLGDGWNGLGITKIDEKYALSLNFPSKANFDETVNRLLEEGVFTRPKPSKPQVYQYGDILVRVQIVGPIRPL